MTHPTLHYCTTSTFPLQEDTIDLWTFSLDTDVSHWLFILSPEETRRADRFHFAIHRQRFRAARILCKKILAHYLDANAANLYLKEAPHGKPYVENKKGIVFNLSHSGNTAILAVGKMAMGVDIEHMSRRPYLGLARSHFAPEEIAALERCPKAFQPYLFFKIWTQKEALIKACGLGLRYPTETFTTHLANEDHATVWDPLHQKMWHMYSFTHHLQTPMALCTERAANIRHCAFEGLMDEME